MGTAAAYRGQGLARQMMAQVLQIAQMQKIPLLWLVGDARFYQRWGFDPALPGPAGRIHLPIAHIPLGQAPGFRVRAVQPKDWSGMALLYREQASLRASQERSVATWEALAALENPWVWVCLSLSGQVEAYLWLQQGPSLEGLEGIARSPEAAAALLQALRPELRHQQQLALNLPPSPFQEICWRWGAAGQSPRHVYPGTWAALARPGHWLAFWQALLPLLHLRLQASPWADRSGRWLLSCEADTVALAWDQGILSCEAVCAQADVLAYPPAWWAAAAMGWVRPEGPEPLPWLFPAVAPWMSTLDTPEELAYGHLPGAQ